MRNARRLLYGLFLAALVVALFVVRSETTDTALAGAVIVNQDGDSGDSTCDATCTLRDALLSVSDGDSIAFDIPGPGPHTIQPTSTLELSGIVNVTIDGYTQDGASANTADPFEPGNAAIQIVLDGSLLSNSDPVNATGLFISASGTTVKGLSIVNFAREGIKVETLPTGVTIAGNYIGVMPDGETAAPNGTGISLRSSMGGNLIGGALPESRNLVSGNSGDGIYVPGGCDPDTCEPVVIAGNWVGTNAAGTAAVPNGGNGIQISSGAGSRVGGSTSDAGNLISGNGENGVALSSPDANGINVIGNRIGTTADGQSPLGNGHDGVFLEQGAFNATIGGEFNANEQNIIAYNTDAGVGLGPSAGARNYIDPNETYSNGGLGADLNDDGTVLPNDDGDTDAGTNNLMNYPIVTGAVQNGNVLTISGFLDTIPQHFYNMFFFANSECDPSGYGEGELFLGSLGLNSGFSGEKTFSRNFNSSVLGGRTIITMSASDPESSSEFSPCVEITVVGTPTPTPSGSATPTPTPTPTPSPSPSPTTPSQLKRGDFNCDDVIDSFDAAVGLRYLATGSPGLTPPGCPDFGDAVGSGVFGDADCDGQFTARDVLAVLIADAGATQLPLPSGCSPEQTL